VPRAAGQDKRGVSTARLPQFFDYTCDTVIVRTAYRCRAYPDQEQQAALNRTFGCVRVVWNRALAERHRRWHTDRTGMSYAQSDRTLTAMKQDPDLAFLSAVSCVPLQIDRWYPSSKTCSACGHLLGELRLGTRHWTCPSCGARHDRDINAAKNILAAGRAVARGSSGDACGADVRHAGTSGCGRR
jgi:transposase